LAFGVKVPEAAPNVSVAVPSFAGTVSASQLAAVPQFVSPTPGAAVP